MEHKNPFEKSTTNTIDVTKNKKLSSSSNKLKSTFFVRPNKKRLALIAGVGIGILTLTGAGLAIFGPKAEEPKPLPQITSDYTPPEPTTKASPLTGVQVEPKLAERQVTGVMIENSIDARPQAGLIDAGVVFEAIAEGGITRFLALFQESKPNYIGPIRSARPYYVRWNAGFDAGYVHSGGSPEALQLIRKLGIKDMDHALNPSYFDRVSNRYAPHNVYTSMSRLDKLSEEKGYTKSEFTPFARINQDTNVSIKNNEVKEENKKLASKITFDISGPLYNTSYTYNKENNKYPRIMAGQKHTDEKSGKQIKPSVLVALIMDYGIHPDGIHSVYDNIGSGKVLIFQNGEVIEGKWQKKNDKASLLFKTKNGDDIQLQPGQTWITAIPNGRVSYTP